MILVTGAGGTVGSEVLKQLREAGQPVRAAFHNPKKASEAKAKGIDAVVLDFADRASIANALQGVDKLFLLGATHPNQSQLEINVVEEAKRAGVKHIVKLSVLNAAGEGFTFARWHRAVEKSIEASGVPYTFLRPTGFMQNFINYSGESIRSQGAFYGAGGDSRTGHIDVRDIAAVAVKAFPARGHENRAYELTGPESLSNSEVAEKLSKATGKTVKYVDVPFEALRAGAVGTGVPEFYADALVDLHRYYAAGKAAALTADVEKVLGRKPRNFDDFARDYAEAFRAAA
jgi:uncharacterized protein YbjT (DUF2867 family)